jgi:hypothetical protein
VLHSNQYFFIGNIRGDVVVYVADQNSPSACRHKEETNMHECCASCKYCIHIPGDEGDEWYCKKKRIDIDEYLEYLYGRESMQDKLETESLEPNLKTALAEADKFFISITKETEKSVLSIKNCDPLVHKDKYWFGYRLLKSKYEQWLLYAHF